MSAKMNIVLLSGGSGKRLWPLSNDIRSKQFIKIFRSPSGEYESMLQRVYRQIREVSNDSNITIATSKSQISSIHNQIGNEVDISIEPARKDTFAAIALVSSYLHDIKELAEDEVIIVCPVDPYVENDFFAMLSQLARVSKEGDANLYLLGITPTYPSAKYGYIIPEKTSDISNVKMFKEKPDEKTAGEYINQGALWNAGVFAFKMGYLLKKSHEMIEYTDYYDLYGKYDTVQKISFDYAVAEKEDKIKVLRFDGKWKDMGTWNTFAESMEEEIVGKVYMDETCQNCNIVNELSVPVVAIGLKDVVVAASPEGVLVTDKKESSYMKPIVDKIDQHIMFAEKSWGNFQVLDVEESSLTIKISLKSGHKMNYHSHDKRNEIWNVIAGTGMVIVDGMKQRVSPGDVITIESGCRHTVIAESELQMIEIQIGSDINVHDKTKYEFEL